MCVKEVHLTTCGVSLLVVPSETSIQNGLEKKREHGGTRARKENALTGHACRSTDLCIQRLHPPTFSIQLSAVVCCARGLSGLTNECDQRQFRIKEGKLEKEVTER
jgi:hypothetical protein